jgi:Motility related/secretion protein
MGRAFLGRVPGPAWCMLLLLATWVALAPVDAEIYQEQASYLPVPEAAHPLDGLLPAKGLQGTGGLLQIKSQYLKRDHRVNFDTRQVEIVSYVEVPAPNSGSGSSAGGSSGSADSKSGTIPQWSSYYSEVDQYSQDMQSLALRRGWLTSLIGKDEGIEGGMPGMFVFDLPFRVPDWMKRVGVDKPKLTINGSYKLVVEGSRQSGNGSPYASDSWFPQLNMVQQPQFSVKGSIGRLISIEINSEEGFGTNLKEQMKISYKGEGNELEDDIIQEIEAGNTSLSLTGTSLTGYTENHKGIFGLKMRMRFGPVEATVIASQEGGAQEKQSLGGSSELKEFPVEDKGMELYKHFWLSLQDRKDYSNPANWIGTSPAYLKGGRGREPKVYQMLFGTEDPTYKDTAQACAYDENGLKRSELCEKGRWKPLKIGVDFFWDPTLRMVTVPFGSSDMTLAANWDRDFVMLENLPQQKNLVLLHSKTRQRSETLDNLMWRNVYNIGTIRKEDRDNFRIRIVDNEGRESKLNDSITYARRLGLEKADQKGKIDYDNTLIFNFDLRYMVLPCLSNGIADGDPANCMEPIMRVNDKTEIYTQTLDEIQNGPTTIKFLILSRERKGTFDVRENSQTVNGQQCFDITPGTEVVTLNKSTKLVKDTDYEVLYETGQITLTSARARDPSAEIEVTYECTPAFQIQDKILLGTRLEWKLDEISEQSLLGATFLYKSQSTTAERPELGREPFSQYLYGFNARLAGEPKWMTKAVNLVPFVKTSAVSKANFEFEVAKSHFDPNTKSSAYIDNFENSQASFSLPLNISSWFIASPPDLDDAGRADATLDYRHQGQLTWHSSSKLSYGNIFGRTGNSYTDSRDQTLLSLRFTPNDNLNGNSWAGIMRGFTSGLNNQSKKRTLEVVVLGQKGTFYVDLGEISEDVSIASQNQAKPNGQLNTEVNVSTGIVSNTKDAGLDDSKEETEGWFWECKPDCYVLRDDISNGDPGRDNWKEPKSGNTIEDPKVNGTEGNNTKAGGYSFDTEDLDRSNSLDTKNRFLRYRMTLDSSCSSANHCEMLQSGWRRYQIPLYGGGTKIDPGNTTTEGGILSNIRIMRMWVGKLPPRVSVSDLRLARVALVGNAWEENPQNSDFAVGEETFTTGDLSQINDTLSVQVSNNKMDLNRLKVDVINKQETPSYKQSPNTPREINTQTDEPLPERSLVLNYEQLHPGEEAFATRLLGSDPKDLTLYDRLLLEVHPDINTAIGPYQAGNQGKIRFGLRLGKDQGDRNSKDYYEIQLHVDSTVVFDEEHRDLWLKNSFSVQLSQLSQLKNDRRYLDYPGTPISKKVYHPERGDSSLTISVIGNPNLSRVDWMRLVIYVDSNATARQSGNIWVNDLRLEGVNRSSGTALRSRMQFDFADFVTASGDMNYTNGDFTSMSQTKATPANSVSRVDYNTAFSLYAGKFFPEAWAISIPISTTYRGSIDRPFVKPSSDIALGGTSFNNLARDLFDGKLTSIHDNQDSAADVEDSYARVYQTTRFEQTFGISYKKDHRSESFLTQVLFERPEIEYKYRGNEQIAYYDESHGRNYGTRLRYNMSPYSNPSYKVFSFTDSIGWMPKAVKEFQLTPLPDKLNWTLGDLNFNRTLEVRKPRSPQEIAIVSPPTYKVDMAHGVDLEWRLFPALSYGYRLDINRNFDDPLDRECLDGSFFDLGGQASNCGPFASNLLFDWDQRKPGRYGSEYYILYREQNRNQTFHLDFNPNLLDWLTTGFGFNSGYKHTWRDEDDLSRGIQINSQVPHFETTSDHSVKLNSGFNLPNLLTSIGSLGGKGFSGFMESAKRKLDEYRVRSIDMSYTVSHKYNGDAYTYYFLNEKYQTAGLWYADQLGWRYGLHNWRTLFDGEPDPTRGDWLMFPDTLVGKSDFNHQVDRSVDIGTGFTLPGPNIDFYGNLKWTKSYTLYRELTPSDTSIIWPEYNMTVSFGDFASKFAFLRSALRTMTANSSFNYREEDKRSLFSTSSDSRLQSYKMTPLLRVSATTHKDIHVEHSFNWSYEDEVRFTKEPDSLKRPYRYYGGTTELTTYSRKNERTIPVKRTNLGNDFSVSYDVETQKGLQFWRYYIKLKNNLRLKVTESANYIKVEERSNDGPWEKSTHEVQFTTRPEASYNFTNNIDGLFFFQYKYRRDVHTLVETSTHDVTVHGEFTMRF